MADSKENTNKEPVNAEVTPLETPVVALENQAVEVTPSNPDKQMLGDFKLEDGENLYFFPDIQKSVVAKSLENATNQVQSEIDAAHKEENK